MPIRSVVALLIAASLTLVGCSSPPPAPEGPAAHHLVGTWQVTGIPGERSWMRIDDGMIALWVDCGVRAAAVRVQGNAFVAGFYGSFVGCGAPEDFEKGNWLLDVASFDLRPTGIVLSDASGRRVAMLERGIDPPPRGLQPQLLNPVTFDEIDAAMMTDMPGLPPGVTPADDITGTWVPDEDGPGLTIITFSENGWIDGQDGCDVWSQGRWRYADSGRVLIAALSHLSFEQDEVDVSSSLYCAQARYDFSRIEAAGMVGGKLTFFDGGGEVIVSVVASDAPSD